MIRLPPNLLLLLCAPAIYGQQCDCLAFPRESNNCATSCDRDIASNSKAVKELKLPPATVARLVHQHASKSKTTTITQSDEKAIEQAIKQLSYEQREAFLKEYGSNSSVQNCVRSACAGNNNTGTVTNNNFGIASPPKVIFEPLEDFTPFVRESKRGFVSVTRVTLDGTAQLMELTADGSAVREIELIRDGSGSIEMKKSYPTPTGMAVSIENAYGAFRFSVLTSDKSSGLRIGVACEPVNCMLETK